MTFSIIIPVYNVAPYLRECLDSVLTQTCADWEAICIDDGSTDGSGLILDEYAVVDDRFKVHHQKNAGVSAARNAGLHVAVGEWISFLDGDDTIEPGWLSSFVARMETNPCADVLMGNFRQYETDGSVLLDMPERFGCRKFSGKVLTEVYDSGMVGMTYAVWNKVFKRDFLESNELRFLVGIPNGEDTFFAECSLAVAHEFVADANITGYCYRMREGSAVHTHTLKRACSALPLSVARIRFAQNHPESVASRQIGLKYAAALLFAGMKLPFVDVWRFCRYLSFNEEYRNVVAPFLKTSGSRCGRLVVRLTTTGPRIWCAMLLTAINMVRQYK